MDREPDEDGGDTVANVIRKRKIYDRFDFRISCDFNECSFLYDRILS